MVRAIVGSETGGGGGGFGGFGGFVYGGLGVNKGRDFIEFGVGGGFVRLIHRVGLSGARILALGTSSQGGAAVKTLGLGVVAEEILPGAGRADEPLEADSETEIAILVDGDLDAMRHGVRERVGGETVGADGFIRGGSGEAGFEGGTAREGLLDEGNSFDGDLPLMVDGLVGGDGSGVEDGELVEVVEADGAEFGRSEPVLAGVLLGAGFALRGARSSGASGVGGPRGHPGGQALFGDGCGFRHTRVE